MGRPRGAFYDPQIRKEVIDLRQQGATYQEIADATGIAISTSHRICMAEGAKKEVGRVEKNLKAILAMIENGMYLKDISKELNIPYNELWLYLTERDYKFNYQRNRS